MERRTLWREVFVVAVEGGLCLLSRGDFVVIVDVIVVAIKGGWRMQEERTETWTNEWGPFISQENQIIGMGFIKLGEKTSNNRFT
jgi:hypothetical protein